MPGPWQLKAYLIFDMKERQGKEGEREGGKKREGEGMEGGKEYEGIEERGRGYSTRVWLCGFPTRAGSSPKKCPPPASSLSPSSCSPSLSHTGVWPPPGWTGRCHTGAVGPGALLPCTVLGGAGTATRSSQSTCGHRQVQEGVWGARQRSLAQAVSCVLQVTAGLRAVCWEEGRNGA